MKFIIWKTKYDIFGMSSINPKKAGLGNIELWVEHCGIGRKFWKRNIPKVKLAIGDMVMFISISPDPEILKHSLKVTKYEIPKFQKGIEYVARNWDIFLAHYMDTTFDFDNECLYQALKDRGEYK